jgi:DNA replication and repair protein RecF
LLLIQGKNGSGKTNILEAMHLISIGRSDRARYDRDMINYEKDFCTVNAKITTEDDSYELELQIIKNPLHDHTSSKRVKVNKVPKTQHSFCGIFNSVMFSPEDINLITGNPGDRRKYIDGVISQTDSEYKRILATYTQAIRQRNKILETMAESGYGQDQIGYWTQQVLIHGTKIQNKRQSLFDELEIRLTANFGKLDKDHSVRIIYKQNKISEERLEEHKEHELAAKTTLIGPHRDDFEILVNDKNSAEFCSRGQQRSIILALKFSEIDHITNKKNERPVLLLDDIFSEFDDQHKSAVIDAVNLQQTIISSADEAMIAHIIKPKSKIQRLDLGL